MKNSGFRSRRVSALSISTLLATAMLVLAGCTVVVEKRVAEPEDKYDTRAQVGLSWHVEDESLERYQRLDQTAHERFDRRMWRRVLDSINEDEPREDRFRTYYNAPDHHEAHTEPGSVREWILENDVLPSNPHDVDEDPDEMIYIWEEGVEYCVHEHEVENSPTPFTVTLPSPEGRITASVRLTVTWRLSEGLPGEGY